MTSVSVRNARSQEMIYRMVPSDVETWAGFCTALVPTMAPGVRLRVFEASGVELTERSFLKARRFGRAPVPANAALVVTTDGSDWVPPIAAAPQAPEARKRERSRQLTLNGNRLRLVSDLCRTGVINRQQLSVLKNKILRGDRSLSALDAYANDQMNLRALEIALQDNTQRLRMNMNTDTLERMFVEDAVGDLFSQDGQDLLEEMELLNLEPGSTELQYPPLGSVGRQGSLGSVGSAGWLGSPPPPSLGSVGRQDSLGSVGSVGGQGSLESGALGSGTALFNEEDGVAAMASMESDSIPQLPQFPLYGVGQADYETGERKSSDVVQHILRDTSDPLLGQIAPPPPPPSTSRPAFIRGVPGPSIAAGWALERRPPGPVGPVALAAAMSAKAPPTRPVRGPTLSEAVPLTPEERQQRIARHLEKREHRNWKKTRPNQFRKKMASTRMRLNGTGRFLSKKEQAVEEARLAALAGKEDGGGGNTPASSGVVSEPS